MLIYYLLFKNYKIILLYKFNNIILDRINKTNAHKLK